MSARVGHRAATVGIGASGSGRYLPQTRLQLPPTAFREALDDAGRSRDDIDGLSLGWPLGVDYDRLAEVFGLPVEVVLDDVTAEVTPPALPPHRRLTGA